MSTYKYQKPTARAFPVLDEGDYQFIVIECGEPHISQKSGNHVLAVKISIQPSNHHVYANPWAGRDKNGNDRDVIAEFLLAVNRAPLPGEEPEWKKIIGAKGKCRLRIGQDLQGAERNEVSFFFAPKVLGPQAGKGESMPASAFAKAQAQATDDPEDSLPY